MFHLLHHMYCYEYCLGNVVCVDVSNRKCTEYLTLINLVFYVHETFKTNTHTNLPTPLLRACVHACVCMCCVCMYACVHSLIASEWGKVARQLEHMTVSREDHGVESTWCCFNTIFLSYFGCLLEKTLKAVGPFYLVSMPGEVKEPTQLVNVVDSQS